MIKITSPSNPIIKMVKSLHKKKQRWERKLFLIEGIKIVEEVVDNNYPIEKIIYSNSLFNTQGGVVLFNKIKHDRRLISISDKIYRGISDTEAPQGILAIVRFKDHLIKDDSVNDNSFVLLLDRVKDPGNMGTIIRTADAFGIDGIIITDGCVDIYNSKVVRATMGSIFRVPIYSGSNGVEIITGLKDRGMTVYSTSLEGSEYVHDINFSRPCILIIGNESRGVSQDIETMADKFIKIPILGGAESFNAAIASSIIMYEVIRQQIQ